MRQGAGEFVGRVGAEDGTECALAAGPGGGPREEAQDGAAGVACGGGAARGVGDDGDEPREVGAVGEGDGEGEGGGDAEHDEDGGEADAALDPGAEDAHHGAAEVWAVVACVGGEGLAGRDEVADAVQEEGEGEGGEEVWRPEERDWGGEPH